MLYSSMYMYEDIDQIDLCNFEGTDTNLPIQQNFQIDQVMSNGGNQTAIQAARESIIGEKK